LSAFRLRKVDGLRILAGLDEATEGVIKIGETVVNKVPAQNRDVAMVFQTYALYPHMNVFDNMAFGLRMQASTSRRLSRPSTGWRISLDLVVC